MSIGLLKKSLTLLNLVAVVTIAAAGYGFWRHNSSIEESWNPPSFAVPVIGVTAGITRIEAIRIPLGRFPKRVEITPDKPTKEPEEEIQSVLKRLGDIKSAVVAYPPFTTARPALIFEFKEKPTGAKENIRTIGLGEALVERPHPDGRLRAAGFTVPYRYKFLRCEPDPEHPGWTYFVFDMNCDGKDIQRARWKLETEEQAPLPTAKAGTAGVRDTLGKGFAVVDREAMEKAAKEARPKPAPGKPETVPVRPETPPNTVGVTGPIFEEEAGTWMPTSDGAEYLKNNYQNILKDAETRTVRDPRTRRPKGVRIVRIRQNSIATQFGLRPNDTILAINDRPVTSQAEAVNIVKAEMRKRPPVHIIRVKVERAGRVFEKRYDTRDPETRRKARAFRKN